MVARGGPIREANQDSEAARRVRIALRRFESIETPTREFSVAIWIALGFIYQRVTGASVALLAVRCMTVHSSFTQNSRTPLIRHVGHQEIFDFEENILSFTNYQLITSNYQYW
jgi:hypothetical protein